MRSVSSFLLMAAPLMLAGCASTVPVPVRALPPVELIQDCPAVAEDVSTNGALVRTYRALKESLHACNNDKAALREWAEDSQ